MKYNFIAVCIVIALLFNGCQKKEPTMSKVETTAEVEKVNPHVKELQKKYAPDKRTAIFNITVVEKGSSLVVRGEVTSSEAKKELLGQFGADKKEIVDSVEILPSENLGDKTWGIITVSVANMRVDPAERAELASQTLMGTVVRLWKKKNGYAYIQTPDKYLGWADEDQLHRVTSKEADEWNSAKKVFATTLYDVVRQQPTVNAYPVCDVAGGDVFKNFGKSGEWIKVGLADGRAGYIQKSSTIDFADWGATLHPVADNIERTGKNLMGVPYLWGGTSIKGVDCSGFTKTVFLLNGQLLNRDASQQVNEGAAVEPGKNFENLRKGDLVFFGTKADGTKPEHIVHVGIYLANREFIHSSGLNGRVAVNSFDPASPIFSDYNLNRFVRARRVIAGGDVKVR
ncbi:MAG: C40 family peptidase [Bacteroidota bacterium]|nr:C40 family peptidase [Bacteroidota bacterium]